MASSKKPALIALALALAALAGYWAYAVHDKREQERAIVALVADTTEQLRAALAPPRRAAAGPLARVEQHFEALQAMRATRTAAFAEGAEHYLLSAREILRRREAGATLEARAASSDSALRAHMASAGRRNASWIQGAATLKRTLEAEHAELRRTLNALDELLETLPEAAKRVAPHIEPGLLLEESVRATARTRVSEDLTRSEKELAYARRLGGR
jgi:hypothetical protein